MLFRLVGWLVSCCGAAVWSLLFGSPGNGLRGEMRCGLVRVSPVLSKYVRRRASQPRESVRCRGCRADRSTLEHTWYQVLTVVWCRSRQIKATCFMSTARGRKCCLLTYLVLSTARSVIPFPCVLMYRLVLNLDRT